MTPEALADLVRSRARGHQGRFMIALAGPPASGKSTLAAALVAELGPGAKVVPMDGFHFDNAVLEARGHLSRKGAPHTFDVAGLAHCLSRIRAGEEVAIPIFDRQLELARAAADVIGPADRILVVEGNYLLLDRPDWRAVTGLFDFKILINVEDSVLISRLRDRWASFGKPDPEAWIAGNDLPNARVVLSESSGADLVLTG